MRQTIFLTISLLLLAVNVHAGKWFVNADSSYGLGDGSSFVNAATISYLKYRIPDGDTICLAGFAGLDHWALDAKYITFLGGFDGTETSISQRNPKTKITTISWGESIATSDDNGGFHFDGITFSASEFHNDNYGVTFTNCIANSGLQFATPFATLDLCSISGTTVQNYDTKVTITNSKLQSIYHKGTNAELTLKNNTVFGDTWERGIEFSGKKLIVENMVFPQKYIKTDGAMDVTFRNVLIHNYKLDGNGQSVAVYHGNMGATSDIKYYNCTIVNNFGGGITFDDYTSSSKVTIKNCIVYNNGDPTEPNDETNINDGGTEPDFYRVVPSIATISYTLAKKSYPGTQNEATTDPLFVDDRGQTVTAEGDYSLQSSSPAVDEGGDTTGLSLQSIDLAGNVRVKGAAIDMGAYEYQSANMAPTATAQTVTTRVNTATITLSGTDADGSIASYAITQPAHGTVVLSGTTATYTPTTAYTGADSFTFTVTDNEGAISTAATITISVVANVVPVANDTTVSTIVDVAKEIALTATDTDGTVESYDIVKDPSNGTAAIIDNKLTYTPTTGFNGKDTVTYKVTDNDGAESAVATVIITVDTTTAVTTLVELNDDKILIYPNPVKDIVTIKTSEAGEVVIMNKKAQVLYNVNGRSINIQKLPKDVYYGVVRDGKEIKAVKAFYKR